MIYFTADMPFNQKVFVYLFDPKLCWDHEQTNFMEGISVEIILVSEL